MEQFGRRKPFIRWFEEIGIEDVPSVGGKNASLGEMVHALSSAGVRVPNGFAVTAEAYRYFLKEAKLDEKIGEILRGLNTGEIENLRRRGSAVRQAILASPLPSDLGGEIVAAYHALNELEGTPDAADHVDVAVRSSATAEDLPDASFAGQQETYLNVQGGSALLDACRRCFASLFTDRAISYRVDKGFDHRKIALSIGVQRMVRSDLAASGVMFSIDTESGFPEAVLINASYGLGENIVQVSVNPDEYTVFKPTLKKGFRPLLQKIIGTKEFKLVYDIGGGKMVKNIPVPPEDRARFALSDDEILSLARWACVIRSAQHLQEFREGEILVTDKTDPDWEPIMKKAAAIITNRGGRTAHAAIVSRELGLPAIVGAERATETLHDGEEITVSCAEGEIGFVYAGRLPFDLERFDLRGTARPKTAVMMNVGNPDEAFALSFIPNDGVGLAREEFIISNYIKIHPMALIDYDRLDDPALKGEIDRLTAGYGGKPEFFVDKLAQGVAMIAAAFHPRDVIVRMSDFKTNEYANLIGGGRYEPAEENPMLGFRGASRYDHPRYRAAFALECRAMKKVRDEMGLRNVKLMIPFCRTVEEGKKVLAEMEKNGLRRGENGLEVYVMCEIPSNVILADDFAEIFDGFSIGSNDLTQLVLGVDRDSEIVATIFDERNPAVKRMIANVIQTAKAKGRKIGICGQAPSDYPDFARFLVEQGIDGISLNPDAVMKTTVTILEMEKKLAGRSAAA